jgi:tRNA(adenine34) deaminase
MDRPGAMTRHPASSVDAHLSQIHDPFMRVALQEARQALHLGEVPVGAAVVVGREVVGTGFNQPIHHVDPTAHAEIIALRQAAQAVGNYRLVGATLYVTVEPCLMCVGAIVHARVSTVVFGVPEPKCGCISSILSVEGLGLNHRFDVVSGVLEGDCRRIMQDFFQFKRREG